MSGEKKEGPLKKMFNDMPTRTRCEFIVNDEFSIINIPWIEKGRGFGEYSFFVDGGKKIKLDNECDSIATVKRVLDDLIDNHPEEVKKMFHQMVDKCELEDED